MAQIKIYGDIDSASIFFVNSTVDPKPMGTIVASLKSDEDRIVIKRNDRFEADGVTLRTIFRRFNPTRVQNRDGQDLVGTLGYSTQEVIDYINAQANLQGVTGGDSTGTDLIGLDICFKLDDTSTSIMMSNGFEFGVNTIKAVADSGIIQIKSMLGDRTHFTNLEVGRACKGEDDTVIAGGLNDVINYLNELFTVGAFEQVVISDPEATTIADVDGVVDNGEYKGVDALDPITDDLWQSMDSGTNDAGYLSDSVIDQAGEYFTFDIRGKGTYMFGLVHTEDSFNGGYYTGNQIYADPSNFCTNTGNAAYGYQWSLGFHIGNAHASWTLYGANTSYKMGEAWIYSNTEFDERDNWNNDQPVKMKVGLDENGYIAVYTKADESGQWKLHARSSYAAQQNSEYRLGIKLMSNNSRIRTQPKVHLLEPEAPTMYFRYIESPDGVFHYPLFATQEEAKYYHEIIANVTEGVSHTHVYVDDPTGTTWHMPDNGQMTGVNAPYNIVFNGQTVLFTEISSLSNSDLVPSTFSGYDLTVDELSTVNYQTQPQDTAYTTTINNLPTGLIALSGGMIGGTAPEVTGDNVANPSDTYTVEVVRTNSYGSSTGTLNIIVTNLTVPVTVPSGFTLTSGNMADSDTLDSNSVLTLDDTLASGKRMIVNKSWIESNVLPLNTSNLEKAYIGVPANNAVWSSVDLHNDFDAVMRWEGQSNGYYHKSVIADGSDIVARSENTVGSATDAYYHYAIQWDGTDLVVMADQDAYKLANTYDYTQMQRYSAYENYSEQSGALPLVFATKSGGQMDVTMTGITFSDIPAEPVTNLTSWTKALDFSGSNEHAKQVGTSSNYMPVAMDGLSATVSAPTVSGNTSGNIYSRPFATSIVFKIDGNNSNQHIWNQGEGSGSSDDNIYVRLSASKNLYFGWGRNGDVNECQITSGGTLATNQWYGLYIAHNGTRLSSSDATASNLAAAFDIRLMSSLDGFNSLGSNLSTSSTWLNTGDRMDRSVTGNFTIGGRGSNRNFHGKVASFVSTTLRINQPMPDSAEIEMMISDPVKWLSDYKSGNLFRVAYGQNEQTFINGATYQSNSVTATQVWLMGDGANDSYSNMIRNQVMSLDQNYTKLQLNSMVSNDIQTVSINGLS